MERQSDRERSSSRARRRWGWQKYGGDDVMTVMTTATMVLMMVMAAMALIVMMVMAAMVLNRQS